MAQGEPETIVPFLEGLWRFYGRKGWFQEAVLALEQACALAEALGPLRFVADSLLARAYGALEAEEGYRCRFGLNPAFREALTDGPLRITATDDQGDARGIELEGHPFFVATLFQPERAALAGRLPPVVRAFVEATAERRG